MSAIKKNKLVVLLGCHALWGAVLWLSISKYGPGISTDSVPLLFGARNLAEGRGLFSFDGSFVSLWPPLYPMLIAGVHLLTGLNPLLSATLLQALAFIGTSVCLSVLFLRIFPENFLLALAASLFSDLGVVVLTAFGIVGSDYIHYSFTMLFLVLAGSYIEAPRPRLLLFMAMIGMLAALQRYLGLAVIATGATVVFFHGSGRLPQRIERSLLLASAAVPAGVWLFVTSPLVNLRPPLGLAENFAQFSESIAEWLLPARIVEGHAVLVTAGLWAGVGGAVILLVLGSRRLPTMNPFVPPLFLYSLFYCLGLFGSASMVFFNKLEGRFLLPLYVPFVTLFMLSVGFLYQFAGQLKSPAWRWITTLILIGVLIGAGAGLLRVTGPVVLRSLSEGAPGENDFNTLSWHQNGVVGYLLNHPLQGEALFSNVPDAIAFYTWQPCQASPRRFAGPYSTEEIPISTYPDQLFSSGGEVYLVWIEPHASTHYYRPEELSAVAVVEPLYTTADGSIFRLKPRAANPSLKP